MQLIKGVIVDIDGCLNSKTMGQPLDLETLHKIQCYNEQTIQDPSIPFITLNSGRPLAYVEAIAQAINVSHFFMFEIGAGIAKIEDHHIILQKDPNITHEYLEKLNQFMFQITQADSFLKKAEQPTKIIAKTLMFEDDSPEIIRYHKILQSKIIEEKLPFKLDQGHNFINILHPLVNKATGMQLFFEQERITGNELAGIGDSNSDWDFMELCAFKACPSNASLDLQKKCDYIAKLPEAKGTLEILNYIIEINRKILRNR
jgi:hydroxymethylpyrimidine pyrophosphatase-like HAD family hydrolase